MGHAKRISRILVADENILFRRGLVALFSSEPSLYVAGEARTPSEVVQKIQELQPEALVIDAALLPAGSATELTAAIRQAQPRLATLVIAQQDTEGSIQAATSCGARGVILKGSAPAEILAAVRSVAFREGAMNVSGLLPEFQALAKQTPRTLSGPQLTAREREVARLLAEGKTVRTVAGELALSMKTVEAHKLNLMRKLDIHDRATLVAYAQSAGIAPEVSAR